MIKKLLLIVAVILVQKASAQITLTEKNIDAVLKQMTLQEKADLLIGCIEGSASISRSAAASGTTIRLGNTLPTAMTPYTKAPATPRSSRLF